MAEFVGYDGKDRLTVADGPDADGDMEFLVSDGRWEAAIYLGQEERARLIRYLMRYTNGDGEGDW